MTTTAQQDALAWFRDLELRVAADGWDQEHALWVVTAADLGKSTDGTQLVAAVGFTRLPLPDILDFPAPVYLEQLADVLRDSAFRDSIRSIFADGDEIIALAMASESWSIPHGDAHGAWQGRNWAEHPGRVEWRQILGVDIGGNTYSVSRARGQSDDEVEAAEGPCQAVGRIPDQLSRILALLRMPSWLV